MIRRSALLPYVLLLASASTLGAQVARGPILDMHMHAREANHYGPGELPMCAPVVRMPTWDQRKPIEQGILAAGDPCPTPMVSPKTDAEVRRGTIEAMERFNIVGVLGGRPEYVAQWMREAPGRFIPALDLRFDRETAVAIAAVAVDSAERRLPPDSVRALHARGAFTVLAEVMNQYAGISPDDPRLEPYWALAEELDIPVGIHIGPGGPAEFYFGTTGYRARLQSALTLEEVLVRHPKMRVYIMHGGYPQLDDLLALLFAHPQVYLELSMICNVETRATCYRYLGGIVESGYIDRVMFGSDQMVWPGIIEPAIVSIEEAPFLDAQQKRAIL